MDDSGDATRSGTLYVLSFGPALAINYRLNADPKMPFYQPLWWAADHWEPLRLFLRWYGHELWYERSLPYRHHDA